MAQSSSSLELLEEFELELEDEFELELLEEFGDELLDEFDVNVTRCLGHLIPREIV